MKNIVMIACLLAAFAGNAQQIHHAQTANVKVYGNCGMCEKTIEKAAFKKGVAKADWDQDTKMAAITFDSTKTNLNEVLQRIADAGYDSDALRAPDAVYNNLHGCCQYERPKQQPKRVKKVAAPSN